jgi:hypothetical protein
VADFRFSHSILLVAKIFFRIIENLVGIGFQNYTLSHRDGLKIAKIALGRGI